MYKFKLMNVNYKNVCINLKVLLCYLLLFFFNQGQRVLTDIVLKKN